VPAAVGLAVLSTEAYGSIYGLEDINVTSYLLAWSTPLSLLFALFTVTAAILQGINEQNYAVLSLCVGFLIKVLFNATLIHIFGAIGSIIATVIAVSVAVMINLWRIKRSIQFSFKETGKRLLLVIILTVIMALTVWAVKWAFGFFLHPTESRL